MCIFAIGNRQAALHCIVFGQVFPANPMNQEFHTVWLLLHLLLNLDFVLLFRFNLWSLLNFTLKQNRALESSNRKWRFLHLKSLMTWMMHGEGGGSRLRNFSWCSFWILTWLIVPLIHPHPHGPMMIRVLWKNIELINQMRSFSALPWSFESWRVTYSEGRCNWVVEMRDGMTGDLDTGTWLMVTPVTTLVISSLSANKAEMSL